MSPHQDRHGFCNPDVVAFAIAEAATFQTVEAVKRFFDVREGHYLAEDLPVRRVEHSWKPVRKMIQPTGRDDGLYGEGVAAKPVVIAHAPHQSSIDENMSYPHDE